MKNTVYGFFKNFLKCGLIGWCMEIIFTSVTSLRRRDMTLKGSTSIWMFPIYGCAAVVAPLSRLLKKKACLAPRTDLHGYDFLHGISHRQTIVQA